MINGAKELGYIDDRGWGYVVRPTDDRFRVEYRKAGETAWNIYTRLPWGDTFEEVDAGLDAVARDKGWLVHDWSDDVRESVFDDDAHQDESPADADSELVVELIWQHPDEVVTAEPFEGLFAMRDDVLTALRDDMVANGFNPLCPLVLWHGGHNGLSVLIDGHTRLAAAKAAELDNVYVAYATFRDEEAALDYVYRTQFARRNVTDAELITLAQKALERYVKQYGQGSKADYLVKRFPTLSLTKAKRIYYLVENASKEDLKGIAHGEITINHLHESMKSGEKDRADESEPENDSESDSCDNDDPEGSCGQSAGTTYGGMRQTIAEKRYKSKEFTADFELYEIGGKYSYEIRMYAPDEGQYSGARIDTRKQKTREKADIEAVKGVIGSLARYTYRDIDRIALGDWFRENGFVADYEEFCRLVDQSGILSEDEYPDGYPTEYEYGYNSPEEFRLLRDIYGYVRAKDAERAEVAYAQKLIDEQGFGCRGCEHRNDCYAGSYKRGLNYICPNYGKTVIPAPLPEVYCVAGTLTLSKHRQVLPVINFEISNPDFRNYVQKCVETYFITEDHPVSTDADNVNTDDDPDGDFNADGGDE